MLDTLRTINIQPLEIQESLKMQAEKEFKLSYETIELIGRASQKLKDLINGKTITCDGHSFWISNNILLRNSIKVDVVDLFEKCNFHSLLINTKEYKEFRGIIKNV